jgi:predicted ATPase
MFKRLIPLVDFFSDIVVLGQRVHEEWTGDLREFRETLLRSGESPRQVHLATLQQLASLVRALLFLLADFCVDLKDQAIAFQLRAGKRAMKRSAYGDAIHHLKHGLVSLKDRPETPLRAERELRLQTVLGVTLSITEGYTDAEVADAYTRAQALCEQAGGLMERSRVLGGQWRVHNTRAELHTASILGEELLRLAQQAHDSSLLLAAHLALGATYAYRGELVSAREHLAQGVTCYDAQKHPSRALLYHTADPKVGCLSIAAWVLQLLGYPDQALKSIHEALILAQQLSHPFSLAYALAHAAVVRQLRREGPAAQEMAEAAIAVATAHVQEQAFGMWWAMGSMLRGWALAVQGRTQEGSAQTCHAVAAWRAPGAELAVPYWLAMLADAYMHGGQTEAGLRTVEEALAVVHNTAQHFYEAELYRLQGELLQQAAGGRWQTAGAPEACFLRAIEIARRQQTKSHELRAVRSLSRLWQRQGKLNDTRQMLAEVSDWFTEGSDTADLQEAKALLKELGKTWSVIP